MTTRYRLLDTVDWQALHGTRVLVGAMDDFIILTPLKAGSSPIIIAQAVKPRSKANGQPVDESLPGVVPVAGSESLNP